MAEDLNAKPIITSANAPAVSLEFLRHILTLQYTSIDLQKEILVRGGHMTEAEAETLTKQLITNYNSNVHQFLLDTIKYVQDQVDKQTGR